MYLVFFIRFLDTDHSKTPASTLDSPEQIPNSGIDVASNTKEVKQPVVVGETKVPVAETVGQESQQLTAVEKTSVNENKTVEEATPHVRNGKKLNASNTGSSVSGSAEQTSNRVIVVANEIKETKPVVVQETVVTETLAESVQHSPSSPEMATVDEQKTLKQVIVVVNEIKETKPVVVQETVVTETLAESVQQSPSSPEMTTVDEQKSSKPVIVVANEIKEKNPAVVQETVCYRNIARKHAAVPFFARDDDC